MILEASWNLSCATLRTDVSFLHDELHNSDNPRITGSMELTHFDRSISRKSLDLADTAT